MTTSIDHNNRLRQLLSELIDGQLEDTQVVELQQLMKSTPDVAEQVVDHLLLDAVLRDDLGREPLTALVDLVADTDKTRDEDDSESKQSIPTASSDGGSHRVHSAWFMQTTGWLAAAACLALVVFLVAGQSENSAFASASQIVEAAVHAHAEPVERVYVVDVQRNPTSWSGFVPPRDVRVFTQGDQFWVQMNGSRPWAWGRDTNGDIWLTLGPRRGMRIESIEVGEALNDVADLYSLSWESLLGTVLRDFRLAESKHGGPVHVITATPRKEALRWIRSMTIEVDRETKAVRRLVVRRQMPRRGSSTQTFTLVDARMADKSRYLLEGHLEADFKVMTGNTLTDRRRDVLINRFGRYAERWITNGN